MAVEHHGLDDVAVDGRKRGVAEPQNVSGVSRPLRGAGTAGGALGEFPAGLAEGVRDAGAGDVAVPGREIPELGLGGDGGGVEGDVSGGVQGSDVLVLC